MKHWRKPRLTHYLMYGSQLSRLAYWRYYVEQRARHLGREPVWHWGNNVFSA